MNARTGGSISLRSYPLFNGNIEVKDGFFYAEGFVEADGGIVSGIGLDEDYVGVFFSGDLLEVFDQVGGQAFSAVGFGDGQVVDVDFAAVLLEFFQYICGEAAYYFIGLHGCEDDELWFG